MKKIIFIMAAGLTMLSVAGQQTEELIRKGNEFYRKGEFEKAEAAYDEALAKEPGNETARFNKANAAWKLNKPDEAIKQLDGIAAGTADASKQARAYYNKGAILSKQKKLEESIEAYKNALRRDPNDVQARENLQKALLELRKKQPPPPKKEDEKKKQQQDQQKKQQPQMSKREAEQKLKLLEQKERELQQRMQQSKSGASGTGRKDW